MGLVDSVGALAASIIAAIIFLVFAILSLFVTVFIVDVAAGLANLDPDEDGFVVLSAAIIAGAAIAAGGAGLTLTEEPETK